MIELINFTRKYGNFTAVDNINLKVNPGGVFGLLGPNGAGKSTIVKSITGAIKPSAGTILVGGQDIVHNPQEIKATIGYIPENPVVFKNLTGREYLCFVGRLYHIPPVTLESRIEEMLNRFGLDKAADNQLFSYSKGMTQKLLIVAALLHNPEVLILDEPLSGLDANAAAIFKETIRSLAARGKLVLFSSHILDVVEKICDRIAILHAGSILAEGTTAQIVEKTGAPNLEQAFIKLTGQTDIAKEAQDILAALE
jgi:ABC-2 type transport system ATP-binding protein